MSTFSERLRLARKERGMNQEVLAQRTGIERSHISHYETGLNTPRLPSLIALAQVLDCSTDWLCGLED
ncbi:helix-turn-helix domain-containing protein [Cupriavidus sp. DL-D2]|uniref:helix-turn-helix domain-containing protein n=1 Tax=Cupriavidus sp. DL-D2 TaxID=3144974 RepID=UPI0032136365